MYVVCTVVNTFKMYNFIISRPTSFPANFADQEYCHPPFLAINLLFYQKMFVETSSCAFARYTGAKLSGWRN